MSTVKFSLLSVLFLVSGYCCAQQAKNKQLNNDSLNWYIEASAGIQMSGIKNEDFIRSNYTPLINISAGKWIVPYFALQVGYKGHYFNNIGDNLKHNYNFYYGEALLNVHRLLQPQCKRWNLIMHAGGGYFYNHFYGKPNTCVNLGIRQNFRITTHWQATFDISSIVGWDIYQGDKDILPGSTIGIIYLF